MARRRWLRSPLTWVMAGIGLLILAEGVVVALTFIDPGAVKRFRNVAADVDAAWNGTDEEPGIRAKAADTFKDAYRDWIQPLWKEPKQAARDDEDPFQGCPKCHAGYAEKRRFTSVYMDHPLHAEKGMECADCHVDVLHPDPLLPEEDACLPCHAKEVTRKATKKTCGTCHPPGALPHFYTMGYPREGVVECKTCHKSDFRGEASDPLIHYGPLDGTDKATCLKCHTQRSCDNCHADPHPSNWLSTHGQEYGWDGNMSCALCHGSLDWCIRCHIPGGLPPTTPSLPES